MGETYYKINVNGTESEESDDYDSISTRWSHIADVLEGRGGHAILYKRSAHDISILELLASHNDWTIIGDIAISPWEVFAELNMG